MRVCLHTKKRCNLSLISTIISVINVFFTVYVVINLPASVSSDRPRAAISSMPSSESLDYNERIDSNRYYNVILVRLEAVIN